MCQNKHKTFLKKTGVLLTAAALAMGTLACGGSEGQSSAGEGGTAAASAEASTASTAVQTGSVIFDMPSSAPEDAMPETLDAPADEEAPMPDWAAFHLVLDDQELTLPFSLEETGNLLSLAEEDNTALEAGGRTAFSVPLTLEGYEDVTVQASFMNPADQEAPLSDCLVTALSIEVTWAEEEKRPDLQGPGGITWGTSAEDVKAALGEPTGDPYKSEDLGYHVYAYDWLYKRLMSLVLYDEEGLTAIRMELFQ